MTNRYRSINSFWVAALLVFGIIPSSFSSDSKIHLKVAVLENFPPQYNISTDGVPEGFAVDTIAEIARLANADIQFVIKTDWTAMFEALRSGEVDLIPNQGITERRKEWFAFTSPVETFPISVFVRSTSKEIRSLEDMAGRKVGVIRLNVGERLVTEQPAIQTVVYEHIKDAFFDLLAGSLDGIVYPKPVLLMLARRIGLEDRIATIGPPLIEIKRAISVRKSDAALLERLDDAVAKFVGSPAYERIYAKWYGEAPPLFTTRQVTVMMGAVLLAVIIAMAWWRYRSLVRLNTDLIRNIHERKRAENKLQEAHDHLENRVRERTKSLRTANAKLNDEIDKRTEAEKQLREKERFLASIFDSIQDGISVLTLDLKIIHANKAMQKLYADQLPLKDKSCFEVYHGRKHPCDDCPTIRAVDSEQLEMQEVPLRQEGRETGVLEVYAFPMFDDEGEITGIVEYVRDMSHKKINEQKLLDLTRKLETAQQLANSGWWEYDVQNDAVVWPDKTYALYGLDPETTVLNYDTLLECIQPDYHEYHNEQLQVMFEKGAAVFQYPIIRPDGEQRWIWAKGETEYDEHGNPIRLFGALQDITERIQIEEQLRLQAQVMRQVHDSIITVAMDGTITSWNRGSEQLFGYNEQEVLGRHIFMVHPEEHHDMMDKEILPNLMDKKKLEIETTLIRKGNQPFEAMISLSVLTNESGELTGMIGYTLDITKRKQAEQALADSERQLKDIIEFLPDPTFVINTEGQVISWNRAIEQITGVDKKEMIGKGEYAYAVPFYGESRPMLIDLLLKRDHRLESKYLTMKEEGDLLIAVESFNPSMVGGGRYLSATAGKLCDAQGNVVGAIETIRDITNAKKAEQEREQLIIELKEAIAQVRTLSGLLPMCAKCKKVRDDSGYWNQLETYISKHTDADVSHGLCPECMDEMYFGQDWYERGKKKGKF